MPESNYGSDFYAWANEQAALLRAGTFSKADMAHIAEAIESMGKAEKRELASRLIVLLLQLIKWRFQPSLRGKSWRLSIVGQRLDIADHLDDNPSLKPQLDAVIAQAWRRALVDAERETGLDPKMFPLACPWSFRDMMDSDFWPD